MKKCILGHVILLLVLVCAACSNDDSGPTSSAKTFTAFKFAAAENVALTTDVNGIIGEDSITIMLPAGINRGSLIATFQTTGSTVTVSALQQQSGITSNNLSNDIVYRVHAEDGSVADYTMRVLTWENMGTASSVSVAQLSIAVDQLNRPVVASRNSANSDVSAMRWTSGTSWGSLGQINITGGTHSETIIDKNSNKPVVACREFGTIRVKMWDSGTTWNSHERPYSGSILNVFDFQIVQKPDDSTYFFIYSNIDDGYRVYVSQWVSGTDWTNRGCISSGVSPSYNSLCMGQNNKPFAAFCDESSGTNVHVLHWEDGTNWTSLGYPSSSGAACPRIVLDPADGKPIVAYRDRGNGNRLRVKKWDSGTTWTDLGLASQTSATNISLAVGMEGKPVILYSDGTDQLHLTVLNGNSWVDNSLPHSGTYPRMTVGTNGLPFVVFSDAGNGNMASVYRLQ